MSSLVEKLPLPKERERILDDCVKLLEQEVKSKGGLSGMAVKAGYKVLKSLSPNAARMAVDDMLDEFLEALEPFHNDYLKTKKGTFGSYMESRSEPVAEALIGVTDRRARSTKHRVLENMYNKLRSSAVHHVTQAVPGLAGLIDRYYIEK
ncbi:MAG: hypothetical protein GXP49_10685 [Deltaproteobacteria bacterium]|nr:hypothetical protein [Deltaproteobacteria bacterium]